MDVPRAAALSAHSPLKQQYSYCLFILILNCFFSSNMGILWGESIKTGEEKMWCSCACQPDYRFHFQILTDMRSQLVGTHYCSSFDRFPSLCIGCCNMSHFIGDYEFCFFETVRCWQKKTEVHVCSPRRQCWPSSYTQPPHDGTTGPSCTCECYAPGSSTSGLKPLGIK